MTFEIREADEDDLEKMSKLWYELALMHQDMMIEYALVHDAKYEWVKFMEESMKNNSIISFLAEEKGEVLGFVSISLRRRGPIFKLRNIGAIMDLIVREDMRNRGIGTSLVLKAESWIRKKGFHMAVLTVAPENQGAIEFWDKLGYKTYLHKKLKKL